ALRQIARDVFGLDGLSTRTIDPSVQAAADRILRDSGDALKAYVKATYEQTQQWFKDHGITEITLYRGEGKQGAVDGLAYDGDATARTVSGSAITSYSADPAHVDIFAGQGDYHSITAMRIPVADVFGTPFTSMAHRTESEFL